MKRLASFLSFGIILIIACVFSYYFFINDRLKPVVTLSRTHDIITPTLPLELIATDASGIHRIQITAKVGEATHTLFDSTFSPAKVTETVTFNLKSLNISQGVASVNVQVTDASAFGFGNVTTQELVFTIDSTPPKISIKNPQMTIRKGGSSLAIYGVDKPLYQTGIRVGSLFFPGFKQENGDFFCFFAFPYNVAIEEFIPEIIAVDLAGNAQITPLAPNKINRIFKHDVINVTQSFLDRKADEFLKIAPDSMPVLERFIAVNNNARQSNAQTLMEIGKNTASKILWENAFLALPRGAVRALFAEHRNYMWEGKLIDEQTHLGYDLASTTHAPIPSASNGTVVFADYLGIYGNLVIIDHGLGLQSLYSHLSEINVNMGQEVKRGDIIGKTGTTGIALGDHLHFGILLAGLEVSPIEWLDAKWMKDTIIQPIVDSSGTPPKFTIETPLQPVKKNAVKKAPTKKQTKKTITKTAQPKKKKRQ